MGKAFRFVGHDAPGTTGIVEMVEKRVDAGKHGRQFTQSVCIAFNEFADQARAPVLVEIGEADTQQAHRAIGHS